MADFVDPGPIDLNATPNADVNAGFEDPNAEQQAQPSLPTSAEGLPNLQTYLKNIYDVAEQVRNTPKNQELKRAQLYNVSAEKKAADAEAFSSDFYNAKLMDSAARGYTNTPDSAGKIDSLAASNAAQQQTLNDAALAGKADSKRIRQQKRQFEDYMTSDMFANDLDYLEKTQGQKGVDLFNELAQIHYQALQSGLEVPLSEFADNLNRLSSVAKNNQTWDPNTNQYVDAGSRKSQLLVQQLKTRYALAAQRKAEDAADSTDSIKSELAQNKALQSKLESEGTAEQQMNADAAKIAAEAAKVREDTAKVQQKQLEADAKAELQVGEKNVTNAPGFVDFAQAMAPTLNQPAAEEVAPVAEQGQFTDPGPVALDGQAPVAQDATAQPVMQAPASLAPSAPAVDPAKEQFIKDNSATTLGAFGSGAVEGVKKLYEGVTDITSDIGNKLGLVSDETNKAVSDRIQADRVERSKQLKAKYGDSLAVPVGEFASQSLAVGGPLGALTKGLVAAGGLSGGVSAALGVTNPDESRLGNAAVGAALGAATGGLIKVGGGLIKGIKGKVTGVNEKNIPASLDPQAQRLADIAKKEGTFVTPGEAMGNQAQLAREGRLAITQPKATELGNTLAARDTQLVSSLQKQLDQATPEGLTAAKAKADELYKAVENTVLPTSIRDEILANPILAAQKAGITADKYAVKKAGTLAEMDKLKKVIDDKINYGKANDAKESVSDLLDAKKFMIEKLDAAVPGYKDARQVAERVAIKQGFMDQIKKLPVPKGQDKPSLNAVYDKLFGTPARQEGFLAQMKNAGVENIDDTKDVIDLINAVRSGSLDKLAGRTPAELNKLGVTAGGGVFDKITTKLDLVVRGKYNGKILDLITNPKWADKVKQIAKGKTRDEKVKNLLVYLTAGTQGD